MFLLKGHLADSRATLKLDGVVFFLCERRFNTYFWKNSDLM